MKTPTLLLTAVLASLAVADVQIFTDNQCSANKLTVKTSAGNCYNIGEGWHSALGCSLTHNLRVFANADCDESGGTQEKAPQKCAALDGNVVRSIKCRA